MNSEKLNKLMVSISENLGTGLSVRSLTEKLNCSYEDIVEVANKFPAIMRELNVWYPKYDFTIKTIEKNKTNEIEDKPLKVKRKTKKTSKESDTIVSRG